MAKLMLVNPARRRKARKTRASPKRRRSTHRRTSHNPISAHGVKRRIRRTRHHHRARANPRRRRRNPISMGKLNSSGLMKMLTNAAIGGAGAVGMDVLMSKVNEFLPVSLQPQAGQVASMNDVVRFGLTVLIGHYGRRFTKGMSQTAATGALAVQAADIGRALLHQHAPAAAAGIGYAVPARTIPGTARIGPNARGGMGAYSQGRSPLLSAVSPGRSPLLSGVGNARMRDALRR